MSMKEGSRIDRMGRVYCAPPDLVIALGVALATERPLLLFGEPGSGKSSVAMWAAQHYQRRYYEHIVTARTQPQDLLWSFDSIRRLGDATTTGRSLGSDEDYVRPGVLWWAYDREDATKLVGSEPDDEWNTRHRNKPVVVLIDEIDKADPDLPNSLLIPLGNRRFAVSDLDGRGVEEETDCPSLIIVTTNEERELPPPFIRRCVVFTLRGHEEKMLREIARSHFPDLSSKQELEMVDRLIRELKEGREKAKEKGRRPPSTAEFLDAVRACRENSYHRDEKLLTKVLDMLYVKQSGPHWEK